MDGKNHSKDKEDLDFLQKELTLFYEIYNELKGFIESNDLFISITNLKFRQNSQENEH